MKTSPPHFRRQRRSGFTLIEVLIALTLSVALVSAIYYAVSLHWRYEQVGRERIQRTQITLAILRLLSEDVGSIAFVPPKTTTGDDAADSTETSEEDTSAEDTDTEAAMTSEGNTDSTTVTQQASLGIVGTADTLQLDVSLPRRMDSIVSGSETAPASSTIESDSLRITWSMIGIDSATATQQGPDAAPSQLARNVIDRLAEAVTLDEITDTDPTQESSGIIAPEVVSLAFRYYDGYSWFDTWDSVEAQRLPRAIEVTMGFRKQEFQPARSLNLPGQEPTVLLKHVLLVPITSPNTGAEL